MGVVMTHTNSDGYVGTFRIILMNDAPTDFIPAEDGVELDGKVVTIADGNYVRMLGCLTFESARKTPFFFSYNCVERIIAADGLLIWKNWNCPE